MHGWKIASSALIAGSLISGSVSAGEQTLEFRLVTKRLSGSYMDVANVAGRTLGAGQYAGVAIFKDGRIAYKNFVSTMDGTDKKGSYNGYSTYTFQNGDALTLKFTGGWSPEGDGGNYEVLSGSGAFKGASGTGRFDAMKEPWEGANLYKGSFTISVPGS